MKHNLTDTSLDNQAFVLMAKLHVILRREGGRVTDIEWMRVDPAYCRHVLGLAAEAKNEEAHEAAQRLQDIYFGARGLFPATPPPPARSRTEPEAGLAQAPVLVTMPPPSKTDQRYIGRLR